MSSSNLRDRRTDERQDRIRRRHVQWNKLDLPDKPRDGWICNISHGGLAILVKNGSRPKVGEHFDMVYDGSHLLCTVIRRDGIERKVSVLGCTAQLLDDSATAPASYAA
jgi:hypothetical protein